MSTYTTSPRNEADVSRVEATSGTTPTVVTRDGIWMSTSPVPTVSTVDTIWAGNGATPTVIASVNGTPTASNGTAPTVLTEDTIRAVNGATPTVIVPDENVCGTSTAQDDERVRMVNGTNPTASKSVAPTVSTENTIRASDSLTPTVFTVDNIRGTVSPESTAQAVGTNPTAIESTSGNGPTANVTSGVNTAQLLRVIVGTQGTGNVAESSTAIVAEHRMAA